MSTLYIQPTLFPAGAMEIRAADDHTKLAYVDEHGIFLLNRRNRQQYLLTRETLLHIYRDVPHPAPASAASGS